MMTVKEGIALLCREFGPNHSVAIHSATYNHRDGDGNVTNFNAFVHDIEEAENNCVMERGNTVEEATQKLINAPAVQRYRKCNYRLPVDEALELGTPATA